jgi:uncharacterized protein (TIGR02453 family)
MGCNPLFDWHNKGFFLFLKKVYELIRLNITLMNVQNILSFLEDLGNNNNRDWFHENKARYDKLKKEFEEFVNLLIPEIRKFDNEIPILSAKECMFRIYNDIRFTKNKPLYKTNFGAFITKDGKNGGHAGYYLHLEPRNCMLAGGIYMPSSENLKLIRQEIYYNYDEFISIISDKMFKKYYHEIEGEKNIRVPKDFPKDFKGAEMLKFKSYSVAYSFAPQKNTDTNLETHINKVFKPMLPFNHFINRALFRS